MDERGYRITDQFGLYFMTFTVVGWVDLFTRKECSQILIDSFSYCKENKGLKLYAYVFMGSHLHLLAAAAAGSTGLSSIVRDFKSFTSKKIIQWITDNPIESRREWLDLVFRYHGKYNANNQVYQVWQQHNKPMQCITPQFTLQKLDYIHFNPVNAGIVDNPEDYRYSSARNYCGRRDTLLEVELLDFGPLIGYVRN
jgi:REP element-mobilizing transposase RayT